MSGILPQVVSTGSVADEQRRLAASAAAQDLSVQACTGLSDSARAAWGQFYTAVIDFTKEAPSWWTSAAQTDRAKAYAAELYAWQQKLSKLGCASANPDFDPNKPPAGETDFVTAMKYAAWIAGALAGAYIVGQAVQFIPKPPPRLK